MVIVRTTWILEVSRNQHKSLKKSCQWVVLRELGAWARMNTTLRV